MKLALCELLLFAATTCFAQKPDVFGSKTPIAVTESKTISVDELQQRYHSRARNTFTLAKSAAQTGDHRRALKLFSKVVRKDPYFSDARNDLAVELVVVGQLNRAVDELQQAVDNDPRFLMGFNNLGVILCTQKRFVEAEAVVRRALALSPYSAKANLLLAMALHGEGAAPAETQHALEVASRSSAVASRLLKAWFGTTDIASAIEPKQ
jgi:Tfp pilus assembly protein PilF